APSPDTVLAYVEKYHDAIERIGLTPEHFAAAYSVAIRVKIESIRGY
ncbi:MAG: TIGR03667 family PPOX class F420-dependent oxidoreductase, partial [Oscillochloris sp.]|nr:TIGR03667 family PPOX class F420-dependent oxidoreductase [Oscillochloris sp.]